MTAELPVRVVRSARRVKTVTAREVNGVLEVLLPSWMSAEEEHEWVETMRRRLQRRRTPARRSDEHLWARAVRLRRAYLPEVEEPASVRWVSNQRHRWGSCTPTTRTIRVSDQARDCPTWVLDYLLLHELAHLVHADHSADFWALVRRYPRADRARGFLEGVTWSAGRRMAPSPETECSEPDVVGDASAHGP